MSATSVAPLASPNVPQVEGVAPFAARAANWLPWLTGVLTLVAALHAIEPLPVGVFYDDAQYLVLAKALATGNGYRFLNLPGAPAATHFPPGYPVFLALLWRAAPSFPENVAIFKFANAILLAMVAVFTYGLARRLLAIPRGVACIVSLAGTATIPSLVLSSAIMSEPLFLALLLPLLVQAEQATRTPDRRAFRTALLLGLASGGLALVRTHGIALGAAIVIAYLLQRRRREAATCAAACIVTLAPWLLWVRAHNDALPALVRGAYGSYVGWFVEGWHAEGVHLLTVTLPDNVATLWMTIVRSLGPGSHAALDALVGAAYLALAAIGIRSCWERARVLTLFVAFYLAIVLVWPFSPLRFVWGIWPLLMLFPGVGAVVAWQSASMLHRKTRRRLVIAATAPLALGTLSFNVLGYANAWWSSNARFHARRVLPQLAWVSRATRPSDVVAADAEAAVYLYTGRRAVPLTTFTAAEYVRERTHSEEISVVRRLLDQYQPRYVLVTSPPLVNAAAQLASEEHARLYRVDSLGVGAVYSRRTCTPLADTSVPDRCE